MSQDLSGETRTLEVVGPQVLGKSRKKKKVGKLRKERKKGTTTKKQIYFASHNITCLNRVAG